MDAVTNLPEIRGAGDNLSPADLISPVMKGPRRTANPTTRAVLGQSNLSNCTPAAEEVECLPGTPKLYESVQPAMDDEERDQLAQQERLIKFGMMLDNFKTGKAKASPASKAPVEATTPRSPPSSGVVTPVRRLKEEPTEKGSPAPPTRSTLAEHPNELKRTPLGLSRHRAWRLSGLQTGAEYDIASPITTIGGEEPIYATPVGLRSARKVLVGSTEKPRAVTFGPATDAAASPGFYTPARIDASDGIGSDIYMEVNAEEGTPAGPREYFLAAGGAPLPTPHTAKFGFTATPGPMRAFMGQYVDVQTPETKANAEYIDIGSETGCSPAPAYNNGDESAPYTPYATVIGDEEDEEAQIALKPRVARSVIFQHAATGSVQLISEFLDSGKTDINAIDNCGRSPLMYSLQYGMIECAEWILGKGADANIQDSTGSTALHYASQGGCYQAVKMLLKNGANPRLLDSEARTPLHWAMKSKSHKIVEKLIKSLNEADINARDMNQMTPLMWAAYYGNQQHISKLREAGALLEAEDDTGRTALHWSIFSGGADVTKYLCTYERTFSQDVAGKSAVHFASETGNDKALKVVIAARPQAVHDIDINGRTPLHWATACKNASTLSLLLKSGAHPTRIDSSGKTAIEYAAVLGFTEGCDILAEQDAENATAHPRLGPANATTSAKSFMSESAMQAMDDEARHLLHQLASGSELYKYSKDGKGPLQKRFFWLDCFTGELCWTKAVTKVAKDPKKASSAYLSKIKKGPSSTILKRADYDAEGKHLYAFELVCESRSLDLVAPSEKVKNLWVIGLQMLQDYATHVLEEKTSGEDCEHSAI